MRLSDLLHSRVVDAEGTDLGSVDDVRLVQDGPLAGAFGASFRVEGLLIGHGGIGVRLGFHRGGVKGPKPLAALFRAAEQRSRYASWDQVVAAADGEVRLGVAAADLRPAPSG